MLVCAEKDRLGANVVVKRGVERREAAAGWPQRSLAGDQLVLRVQDRSATARPARRGRRAADPNVLPCVTAEISSINPSVTRVLIMSGL